MPVSAAVCFVFVTFLSLYKKHIAFIRIFDNAASSKKPEHLFNGLPKIILGILGILTIIRVMN
jgi:hypothetical protein